MSIVFIEATNKNKLQKLYIYIKNGPALYEYEIVFAFVAIKGYF